MRTLYLDCGMGAAGDMLTAALLELLPEGDSFLEELNALGIPGVEVTRSRTAKCGIQGTSVTVKVRGAEEADAVPDQVRGPESHEHVHEHEHLDHDHEHHEYEHHEHEHHEHEHHDHEHHHDHGHGHHHAGMGDILQVVEHLAVSEQVKSDILAVYGRIAQAESHAHGVPVTEIHFHEVGTMDAVADITAVCLLMERLAPEQVVVSPVHVGCGQVQCAHGILPVPAPATAYILQDVPIYGGQIQGELCTPTGAALLRHFATRFGPMPAMRVQSVGYGMGKRDFPAANCVRAMLGETEETGDTVTELSCDLDDMTPEALAFAQERLYDAGALEVFTTPIQMKKSRPGTLLTVLCRQEDTQGMVSALFRHTTTLGVREQICRRYTLARRVETVTTPYGEVRKKISSGYGVLREKLEYEDLARAARSQDLSLAEVTRTIAQQTEHGAT